jgi:putative phosphonate transport system ATP-binding protein
MTEPRNPILRVNDLTKMYGQGCPRCLQATGPEYGTNICSHCGTVVACAGISFDLYVDEILGVVGESGSGKSSLIRLLHFDDETTSGQMYLTVPPGTSGDSYDIAYQNTNVFELSPFHKRQLRNSRMGIVYQNPQMGLRMGVSAGGNVAERLIAAGWRNIRKMRERTSYLLEKTEIPVQRMDEPPRNFSGGMQQRVQIAKSLSNSPLVLFFDEVTSGLDLSVQARVLDLIRGLQREFRLSFVVVSHDLGVIRLLTSRTMVMKYGRVVESGLTDQILEDPCNAYTQLLVSSQL